MADAPLKVGIGPGVSLCSAPGCGVRTPEACLERTSSHQLCALSDRQILIRKMFRAIGARNSQT